MDQSIDPVFNSAMKELKIPGQLITPEYYIREMMMWNIAT